MKSSAVEAAVSPVAAETPASWPGRACALYVFVLAALGALGWSVLCTAPGIPWNPARLASSAALVEGLPLYALRDSGAHLGWFYGPGFPLWHAPAMLFANITVVHMVAAAWNALSYLLPVVLALHAGGLRGARLAQMSLLAATLLIGHGVTHRNFYFIHVDVVCLAWGVLACVTLHRAAARRAEVWLHAAAFAAVGAVWTKQIAIALLPALLLWTWRTQGRTLAARLTVWLAVYGALTSLLVFRWFGPEEVLFNTVMIHLRNPNEGGWELLAVRIGQLLRATLPWLPLMALALWLGRKRTAATLPAPAGSLAGLLVGVALWLLPLGLSATVKEGGGLNSVHSLHYGMIAALLWLAPRLERGVVGASPRLVAALVLGWLVPLGAGFWWAKTNGAVWIPHRAQEHLVRLAREQPGKFYFPWNPLVTLREEGRIQPLDNALYCLWLAGLEPPAEKVRAAVAPGAVIVYEEPAQSRFALRYFPEYSGPKEP